MNAVRCDLRPARSGSRSRVEGRRPRAHQQRATGPPVAELVGRRGRSAVDRDGHPLMRGVRENDGSARCQSDLRRRPFSRLDRVELSASVVETSDERTAPGRCSRLEDVDRSVVGDGHVGESPRDGERDASRGLRILPPAQKTVMHLVEEDDRARGVDVERRCADGVKVPTVLQAGPIGSVAPTSECDACIRTAPSAEHVPTEGDRHAVVQASRRVRRVSTTGGHRQTTAEPGRLEHGVVLESGLGGCERRGPWRRAAAARSFECGASGISTKAASPRADARRPSRRRRSPSSGSFATARRSGRRTSRSTCSPAA